MQAVLQQVDRLAATQPDATAVVHGNAAQAAPAVSAAPTSITWQALQHAARRFAQRLREATHDDAVILLTASNHAATVASFLGVFAADRSLLLMHPAAPPAELMAAGRKAGASLVLADADRSSSLDESLDIPVWDVASRFELPSNAGHAGAGPADVLHRDGQPPKGSLFLQSSSTTGPPKMVRRSAASLDVVARNVVDAVGLRSEDRVLAIVPMTHSYGMENGLLAPLLAGARITACDRFDPQAVASLVETGDATVLPGVPAMYEMLCRLPDAARRCAKLRLAYAAGAPLPTPLHDELAATHGLRVGQLFGSTEIGSVSYESGDAEGFNPAGVGFAMSGVGLRVLPIDGEDLATQAGEGHAGEGQVAVRSPCMFDGYVRDTNEAPAVGDDAIDHVATEDAMDDGYFLTGDLGRLDEHGRLFITGRLKFIIDVGAAKVNPMEVERVLAQCEGVAGCVVLPAPVSETVHRVRAIIEAEDDQARPSVAAMRAHCRAHLSPHKVPRSYSFVASLPRSPTGKVLRRALLEQEATP